MEISPGIRNLLEIQEYIHTFNNDPEPWDGDISIIDGDLHMYGDGEWTNIEMKTELNVDGEWVDITEDVRWKERFGTPPPTVRRYVPRKECKSFWSWFSHDWRFANAMGYYEVGTRFLGRETIRYYIIPRGDLRF